MNQGGESIEVIEKVHYEDILEPEIVQLIQPLVKDKMDQLFITSEHFAIDIDKLLFQLNLKVNILKWRVILRVI